MHELPIELAKSLRSWRGSVCVDEQVIDVEKQDDGFGSKLSDEALSSPHSSLIRHPRFSNQALDEARRARSPLQAQGQQQASYSQQPRQQAHPQRQTHAMPPNDPPPNARNPGPPPQTTAAGQEPLFTAAHVKDPDSAAERLQDETKGLTPEEFFELMGMKPPIAKNRNPKNLIAGPHGLYGTILAQFNYIQNKYRAFDILTYGLLALQLIISAVFIVLGSLTQIDSHIAIAVLGAVSTLLAGSLALMKGQGLPNRLRQTRDALRNVKFEAEELYADVGADRPVLYRDVKKLREDYLSVMEQARNNHPDTWNTSAIGIGRGLMPARKAKDVTMPDDAMQRP